MSKRKKLIMALIDYGTQKKLAEATGITESTISRIVNGDRCSLAHKLAIAGELEKSIEYLFGKY